MQKSSQLWWHRLGIGETMPNISFGNTKIRRSQSQASSSTSYLWEEPMGEDTLVLIKLHRMLSLLCVKEVIKFSQWRKGGGETTVGGNGSF